MNRRIIVPLQVFAQSNSTAHSTSARNGLLQLLDPCVESPDLVGHIDNLSVETSFQLIERL